MLIVFFFFQAEDGIRDKLVTGVQTCALPIYFSRNGPPPSASAGASPRGAKVEEPMSAGPVTGWRGDTVGTPASANPARWGSAKISATSVPRNASHRSRTRCRSEEHTSELQSLAYLVCRLLLEKKKKKKT